MEKFFFFLPKSFPLLPTGGGGLGSLLDAGPVNGKFLHVSTGNDVTIEELVRQRRPTSAK